MASELIITSARKGLDGGSGFQPVLRTRGMAPSLAERIRIRAGYSHPYTQGDARNPIVFVHRTERVGGENLHFLIRLADAGSDHTGLRRGQTQACRTSRNDATVPVPHKLG